MFLFMATVASEYGLLYPMVRAEIFSPLDITLGICSASELEVLNTLR